jgi:hypothetical protein
MESTCLVLLKYSSSSARSAAICGLLTANSKNRHVREAATVSLSC